MSAAVVLLVAVGRVAVVLLLPLLIRPVPQYLSPSWGGAAAAVVSALLLAVLAVEPAARPITASALMAQLAASHPQAAAGKRVPKVLVV